MASDKSPIISANLSGKTARGGEAGWPGGAKEKKARLGANEGGADGIKALGRHGRERHGVIIRRTA